MPEDSTANTDSSSTQPAEQSAREKMDRLAQIPESELAAMEEKYPKAVHLARWAKICGSDLPLPEKKAALQKLLKRQ
jgi:hypothetical protein